MKVIEKFADEVINSGTYQPLDRVYVVNKIRGLVGDHDEEENDQPAVKQLVGSDDGRTSHLLCR